MEFKLAIPRDIVISPSHNNGFTVTTGCCRLVFADRAELIAALGEYLADPDGHEKKYGNNTGEADARPQEVVGSGSGVRLNEAPDCR